MKWNHRRHPKMKATENYYLFIKFFHFLLLNHLPFQNTHKLRWHTTIWIVLDNQSFFFYCMNIDLGHHDVILNINKFEIVCGCACVRVCVVWRSCFIFIAFYDNRWWNLFRFHWPNRPSIVQAFDLIQWIKCIDENRKMDPSDILKSLRNLFMKQSNAICYQLTSFRYR